MEAVKRGLKHGLDKKDRCVLLMLDEAIITETPPLPPDIAAAIGVAAGVPVNLGVLTW
jgi:hypothetical protein